MGHRVGPGDVFVVVRLAESGQHDGRRDGEEEPAPATAARPGRVWSPRKMTPMTAGGIVSASTTAAVATVTLPPSSAVA